MISEEGKTNNIWHWVSSEKMTFACLVENDTIIYGAPIIRKFIGQPFNNLLRWMDKQGGLKYEVMN